MNKPTLKELRLQYEPQTPSILKHPEKIQFVAKKSLFFQKAIQTAFPYFSNLPLLQGEKGQPKILKANRIGVVFSGGPAPGGHNVVSGLFDALQKISKESVLIGFLDGPQGIVQNKHIEISESTIKSYRNIGGFHLLGSGRTKIETTEQMESAYKTCQKLNLDGLVIIGGDDSNTNAALLAEFFHKKNSKTCVIGIPKTIDADLKNEFVPISFGFDTACKVYSEMIGNICLDALSSKKYTHFIKLMGRSASHITLECALSTQPNYTFIGEEIEKNNKTLHQLIEECADLIIERASLGKSYGVILVPEGLFQFIPEIGKLIEELNSLLSDGEPSSAFEIIARLSAHSKKCFDYFPETIQKQLLLRRDPHGNVQLSLIETEKLLADLVDKEIEKRKGLGLFHGNFHPITHFLGYEGRCAFPSNFDADYGYSLGHTAALLIQHSFSGFMAFIENLNLPPAAWNIGAVPIVFFMHEEKRKGTVKPVIAKKLVDCEGPAFTHFLLEREKWKLEDSYLSPGPIQYGENSGNYIPLSINMELSQ